ncbi:MAG: 3-oxoadipate CoA-transferase [Rhodospirillales bacterium 70-18]|mgnify:CR=1 FL=1|nr:3-oxoacid CoA-transferase subunit A [Rhodospirillales bacterium]OJY65365.1 MAG: 3-oxoadipate CoA-transferase [Rhodospirillales bacterium 70-18]
MIDKTVRSMAEAMADIKDGATVLVAGFAGVGEPRDLLEGLVEQGARDLTIVANTVGRAGSGIGRLVELGRVRRLIVSWARSNPPGPFEALYKEGKVELELVPQGTLAERMHAAGAGVPAFFTATAVGTPLAAGKEHRRIKGRTYVLEESIFGDVGLVEAWQADRWGNLTYRRAGRNFNPVVAMASRLTIAQTQHIVPLGELDPDHVVTSGVFVDRVLHVPYGDPPF